MYIHNGKIHIIPFSQLENNENIQISEALEIIQSKPLLTEASVSIQDAVLNKINDFPEKIKTSIYHAKAYLPVAIAAILNHKPGLISSAVTSFCNRDPLDMKACRAMKYFPPENRVYSRVTFTKFQFAMLAHSNFKPDAKTGWNLPPTNSPQYKSHLLGIKIACGFEILASQVKSSNQDLESDRTWRQYLAQLKNKKYFKEYLPESQEYNNLLNSAKVYFMEHRDTMFYSPVLGQEIIELNKTLEYNIEDLKKAEESIPEDDDDSWLNIDPEELDKLLEEQYGNKIQLRQTEPQDVTKKLDEFLHHMSDVDGVEFPTENKIDESPVRPKRGIKKNKVKFSHDPKPAENTAEKINFDASNFSCVVQNILDLVIPEDSWDLESGSEMSEYDDEPDIDFDKMDSGEVKNKMKYYMDAMDKELASTSTDQSFEKGSDNDKFDDIENFKPVDIDMTALKNMLQSYQAQMGGPGPATNMLGPMGVHLQHNRKPDSQ